MAAEDNDLSFTLVIDSGAFKIEMQKVKKETGEVSKAATTATSRLAAMEASFKKASEANSKLSKTLGTVKSGAVSAAEAIRNLTRATDAMILRVDKVKLADAFKINVAGLKDLNKLADSVGKLGLASANMRKEFKFEIPKAARAELSAIIRETGNLIRALKSVNAVPKFKFPAAAREEVNKLVLRIDALRRSVSALSTSLATAIPFVAALNGASVSNLQASLSGILQTLRFIGPAGRAAVNGLGSAGRNRTAGSGRVSTGRSGFAAPAPELNNLVNEAFNGTFAKLRDLSVLSSGIRNVFLGLRTATFGWQSGILAANGDLERTTQLLRGLSTQTTIAGIFEDAKNSAAQLYELAARVPFEIKTLSAAAGKFASVGINPLAGSLKSLSDAVSNFGGTQEVFSRATTAIQQMGGKGVVSLEELRQQLGEAVPSAIKDLANAAGTTQADLVKKITKGTVESTRALELLFAEFERRYAGGSERFLDTYEGVLSRLSLSWKQFQQVIGNTSYFENIKAGLRELTAAFESEQGVRFGQSIGNALSGLVQLARQAAPIIARNIDLIGFALKNLFSVFIASRVFALTASMVKFFAVMRAGAIASTIVSLARLPAIFTAMAVQSGIATAAVTMFGIASATAGAALRAALGPLLIPLGAAIAAYYAVTKGIDAVGEAADEAADELGKYKTAIEKARGDKTGAAFLDPVLVKKIQEDNAALKTAIEQKKQIIAGYKALLEKGFTTYGNIDLRLEIRENEAQIKLELEQYERVVKDLIEKPVEYRRRATIKTEYQNISSDIASNLELVGQQYEQESAELEKLLIEAEKKSASSLAAEQRRQAPLRAKIRRDRFDLENAERVKELDLLKQQQQDALNDVRRFTAQGNKESLAAANDALFTKTELIKKVQTDILKAQNDFARNELNSVAGLTILGNKDEVANKLSRGTKLLEDLQVRVDQLKQKANDPTEPGYLIKLASTLDQLQRQTGPKGVALISDKEVKKAQDLIGQIGQLDNIVEASEGFRKMNEKVNELRSTVVGMSTEQEKFNDLYLATQTALSNATSGYSRINLEAKIAKGGIQSLTEAEKNAYDSYLNLQQLPGLRNKFEVAQQAADRYKFVLNDVKRVSDEMRQETRQFNQEIADFGKTEVDRLIARVEQNKTDYRSMIAQLDDKIRVVDDGEITAEKQAEYRRLSEQRDQMQANYENYVAASEERIRLERLGALSRLVYEQRPFMMQLEEASVGWVDRSADALTQFAETGKLAFGSFAKSVLKDILRIINKMLILRLVQNAIGGFPGFSGSSNFSGLPSSSSLLGTGGIGGQFLAPITNSANGNIMTSRGPARLAQNFTGITKTPRYSVFGEGKTPEAIIPLPDGRTVPVTISGQAQGPAAGAVVLPTPQIDFVLVNNTGQPMAARQESSGPSADGKKLIMQVVLEGVSTPGTYRESFKSALRQ